MPIPKTTELKESNMEKEFDVLWKELSEKYPDYVVTMGIARYDHQDTCKWWIELKSKDKVLCGCCGTTSLAKSIAIYSCLTYEEAVKELAERFEVENG